MNIAFMPLIGIFMIVIYAVVMGIRLDNKERAERINNLALKS